MKSNKTIKYLLTVAIILLITAVCVFSLFTDSFYVGDDATFHINRIIGLSNCFEERQILPKIYPFGNNGFGYASPLFYCDLFLYPFGILYHFGVGAVLCYKLAIIFYVLLGNLFAYYVIKKITHNDTISFVGLALYTFNNYHLQNILLRSAFGEVLAMSFIPLIILAMYEILVKDKDSWLLLGVSFSLVVMSHLISALLMGIFFGVMIIVYIIFNRKDKERISKTIKTILKGTVLALLLTAWYLAPMIEQLLDQTFMLTINQGLNDFDSTKQNISSVFSIFACADIQTFDSIKQASVGIITILLTISYVFVQKNRYITTILIYTLVIIMITIGILPYNYLKVIQFVYRNYIVIATLLTIVSIYVLINIKKNRSIIMIAVVLFLIVNSIVINMQVLKRGPYYLYNESTKEDIDSAGMGRNDLPYNHNQIQGGEYLPYAEDYINYNEESQAIKIIDNRTDKKVDTIWDYDRRFTRIEFNCSFSENTTVVIPLSYYKGYKGYELINGDYKPINLYNFERYKELAIDVPAGSHAYMTRYEGTSIQKIALLVSAISAVNIIVVIAKKKKTGNTV